MGNALNNEMNTEVVVPASATTYIHGKTDVSDSEEFKKHAQAAGS